MAVFWGKLYSVDQYMWMTAYNTTVEPLFFQVFWDEFYRAAKRRPIDQQHCGRYLK